MNVSAICCQLEVAGDIFGENVKNIEGYAVLNFEVACSVVSEIFKTNQFVTAEAEWADIDDSIKRKRIHVSLNNTRDNGHHCHTPTVV